MTYTYTLNALGRAAILDFIQDRGLPDLNPEAFYASAEVEADNFNPGGTQRGVLDIPEHSSKDGLHHRLLLEQRWFHKEFLPPEPDTDILAL